MYCRYKPLAPSFLPLYYPQLFNAGVVSSMCEETGKIGFIFVSAPGDAAYTLNYSYRRRKYIEERIYFDLIHDRYGICQILLLH